MRFVRFSPLVALVACAVFARFAAAADLIDIVAARPCSSIVGDRVAANGNCKTESSEHSLSVDLKAAGGKYTFELPAGIVFPETNPAGPAAITVDNLMLFNGAMAPEVWRLNAGDILRVKLTNNLPPGELAATNLHTHGLLVSPDLDVKPAPDNPQRKIAAEPVGDTVYVCTVPAGEKTDSESAKNCRIHASYFGAKPSEMNYELALSKDHPEGLYWYHPHVHMNARTQVGSGLSGLIYIKGADRAVSGGARTVSGAEPPERFMMLKDIQVGSVDASDPANLKAGFLPVEDHDAGLCGDRSAGAAPPRGACFLRGDDPAKNVGWLFTVNGQLYPRVSVKPGEKQIWRIANVSADMTYDLALVETGTGRPLRVQILARDGVAAVNEGGKKALLTERILLMPAARIEIAVDRATAEGLVDDSQPLQATLRNYGFFTGGASGFGDAWPAVDLAEVVFDAADQAPSVAAATPASALNKASRSSKARRSRLALAKQPRSFEPLIVAPWKPNTRSAKNPAPSRAGMKGVQPAEHDASMHMHGGPIDEHPLPAPATNECTPLARGEDRIIALAIDKHIEGQPEKFKIGAGRGRPGSADWDKTVADLIKHSHQFGDKSAVLCAHAGHVEEWTIVNRPEMLADGSVDPKANNEAHNFHIHQLKFEVVEVIDPTGRINAPLGGPNAKRKVDTFPVPIGGSLRIRIHFTKQMTGGRFVFHCHILEHEDKGMMAEIEVKK